MASTTAIIIGGGVIGLSTAYHLARKGFGKIMLLEKGSVGDGSSSRAGGIITGLLWSETGVLARKISLALYRELSANLPGYRFGDVGGLNLFDPLPGRNGSVSCRSMIALVRPMKSATVKELLATNLTPLVPCLGRTAGKARRSG